MIKIYWHTRRLEEVPADEGWLSNAERKRLAGFKFPKRRQEWLLGRWTAKQLLTEKHTDCFERPLQEITIGNTACGAPAAFIAGSELAGCLSLSHREELACAAWTDEIGVSIGVDLEAVETKPRFFVEDYFTINEAAAVFSFPEEEQSLAACLVWSAKEAVLKALKVGLRLDTRMIEIALPDSLQPKEAWQLLSLWQVPNSRHVELYWRMAAGQVLTMAVISSGEMAVNIITAKDL